MSARGLVAPNTKIELGDVIVTIHIQHDSRAVIHAINLKASKIPVVFEVEANFGVAVIQEKLAMLLTNAHRYQRVT